jgi:16S rRNA A1518/A1519 N6-dimethyltransferase RsmA/KsgA/DIM1 with predicted DNA glycosylase/AP lyase activity
MRPRDLLPPDEIRLVKMLFSQRRRKLSGALKQLELKTREINPEQLSRRVQDLFPPDFRGILDGIEEERDV